MPWFVACQHAISIPHSPPPTSATKHSSPPADMLATLTPPTVAEHPPATPAAPNLPDGAL